MIDHKRRYNENVSAPPFDRVRVVSVVEPQSWGCRVLAPSAVRLWPFDRLTALSEAEGLTAPSPSADGSRG